MDCKLNSQVAKVASVNTLRLCGLLISVTIFTVVYKLKEMTLYDVYSLEINNGSKQVKAKEILNNSVGWKIDVHALLGL